MPEPASRERRWRCGDSVEGARAETASRRWRVCEYRRSHAIDASEPARTPPTRDESSEGKKTGRRNKTGLPVGKYTHVVAVEHRNDQVRDLRIDFLLGRIAGKDLVVLEGLLLPRTSHFNRDAILGKLDALPAALVAAVLQLSRRHGPHATIDADVAS